MHLIHFYSYRIFAIPVEFNIYVFCLYIRPNILIVYFKYCINTLCVSLRSFYCANCLCHSAFFNGFTFRIASLLRPYLSSVVHSVIILRNYFSKTFIIPNIKAIWNKFNIKLLQEYTRLYTDKHISKF